MAINNSEKPRLPIENTGEQHLACVVLIDTSESMSGYEKELRNAIAAMKESIMGNDTARGRVEICLVTFDDDVKEESPFGAITRMEVPFISCGGMTCTHAAIRFALNQVVKRKEEYRKNNVTYNQPWIWLLTDGGSNDADNGSFEELLKAQKEGKCAFFGVAVGDGVNEAELCGMHKDGMMLRVGKDNLAKAFEFISQSVTTASANIPGEKITTRIPDGLDVKTVKQPNSEEKSDISDGTQRLLNDKEHMIQQANAGNKPAMRFLASLFRKEGNLDKAIEWADKAVSAGDFNALGQAVLLHYERLVIRAKQMPQSANGVFEDSDFIISSVPLYMVALASGQLENDSQLTDLVMTVAQYGYYCYSFMLFSGDQGKPIDIDKALKMLDGLNGTRDILLRGLILATKGDQNAIKLIEEGLYDNDYRNSEKDFMENLNYQSAVMYMSTIARQSGNLEKAVNILHSGISGITDIDMRQDLQAELKKYQKRMLGGWKYNG